MPAAMLANPEGLIFRPQPLLLPSANNSVTIRYCFIRHTRSKLRDNRFCGYGWDNYPIPESAANLGVFVRDSNSAVTVKLPTRREMTASIYIPMGEGKNEDFNKPEAIICIDAQAV